MARYYSYVDTTVGFGSTTVQGMLDNGNQYGVVPSIDIVARNITATGNFIGTLTSSDNTFNDLRVTGIATIGIVTGATYYGDGSNLTGVSGGDADLLDGQEGSYYLDYNNLTNLPDTSSISQGDTSAQVVDTGTGGHFKVITDGTEKLRVDSSGRVGLGTNNLASSSRLTLLESTGNGQTLEIKGANTGGAGSQPGIKFTASTGDNIGGIFGDTNSDAVILQSGGSERMRIDNSGNFGIGLDTSLSGFCVNNTIRSQNTSSNISYIGFTDYTGNTTVGDMYSYMGGDGRNTGYLNFSTNDTERMRITSSGFLGIGTTSPVNPLHIANQYPGIRFQSNSGSYQGRNTISQFDNIFYIEVDNDNAISNSALAFTVDSSERMRIDSSGNVGIGTMSPGSFNSDGRNLVVGTGSGGQGMSIYSGTSNYGTLYFADGTTGDALYRGAVLYNHSSDFMRFDVAASERMRIDSSGNVVIGETSAYSGAKLTVDNSGGSDVAIALSRSGSGQNDVALLNSGGEFIVKSGFASTVGDLDERMRIDSSGNMGIGTKSPSDTLHLDGSTGYGLKITDASSHIGVYRTHSDGAILKTASNHALLFGTNDTERVRIDSSGRLLIGHTSASNTAPLQVTTATSGAFTAQFRARANNDYSFLAFSSNDGSEDLVQIGVARDAANTSRLLFYTNNGNTSSSERMRIDSSGFIHQKFTSNNSSTPEGLFINNQNNATGNNASLIFSNDSGNRKKVAIAAVDVGNYGASDLVFALDGTDSGSVSLSSDEKMRIDSSGKLGIGTKLPQRNLHIHTSDSSTNTYLQLTSATTGTSSTDGFQLWAYGNGGNLNATIAQRENADLEFWTNNTEAMRLDSFGSLIIGDTQPGNTASYARNLIIGTTSGNNGMSIVSGTDSAGTINFSDGSGANATQGIIQYEHPNNFMRFYTADTEWMRIESTGTLRTFMTGSSGRMHLATDQGAGNTILFNCVHSRTSIDTGGTASCRIYSDGDIENTNNSYGVLSDESLKENIVDANSQWDDIKSLRIRNFNFKEKTGISTHTQIGVVAQEVELVSPGLVKVRPDVTEDGEALEETLKTVNSSVLYMKAVKALQEAMERIETLEQRLTDTGIA